LNRVYARQPVGPLDAEAWVESLRRGRTVATNGPLLDFTLGGETIGGELQLPAGSRDAEFTASLRSIVPVDHLEVVCNGGVVRDLKLEGQRDYAEVQGSLPITQSGWCLLRAWNEKPRHPILDIYPYATTSPIYVTVDGAPARSPEDAAYFVAWIDRIAEAVQEHRDWKTEQEKSQVMKMLSDARAVYLQLRE
ncbi:MAG: CehA/McbA family metallohydrolase, partial [Acidobacteria bacterium]|nr:CehA/McbA family metallohydrolase [Acidobacteriota bacterium]